MCATNTGCDRFQAEFKTTLAVKIVDKAFNAQVLWDFCCVSYNKLPYKFSDNFNEMATNVN